VIYLYPQFPVLQIPTVSEFLSHRVYKFQYTTQMFHTKCLCMFSVSFYTGLHCVWVDCCFSLHDYDVNESCIFVEDIFCTMFS